MRREHQRRPEGGLRRSAGRGPGDVDQASLVVLWGCNPSASGIHLVPKLRALQARGGKLVVVDPRRTPLAKHADLHLAPLPGTDVVLAMALARLAFAEGHADEAFLAPLGRRRRGVPHRGRPVDPRAGGGGLRVPADRIREAARLYAEARPALIRAGWGLERTRNGTDAVRAVLALPAVYGKFGERGSGWALSTSAGYRVDSARWQGEASRARVVNMTELGRILEETRDPTIRALYVYDCNPAVTVPDQGRVLRQLAREDLFTVVHEQVHTDTVDYANVVLPATTFLEHRELVKSFGGYLVQWSEPAIAPVGEARSNHAVMADLAARLGLDEPALAVSEDALAREMAGHARVDFER